MCLHLILYTFAYASVYACVCSVCMCWMCICDVSSSRRWTPLSIICVRPTQVCCTRVMQGPHSDSTKITCVCVCVCCGFLNIIVSVSIDRIPLRHVPCMYRAMSCYFSHACHVLVVSAHAILCILSPMPSSRLACSDAADVGPGMDVGVRAAKIKQEKKARASHPPARPPAHPLLSSPLLSCYSLIVIFASALQEAKARARAEKKSKKRKRPAASDGRSSLTETVHHTVCNGLEFTVSIRVQGDVVLIDMEIDGRSMASAGTVH